MVMNLVILAIVLASFALGFRIADIRAEVLDRIQRRTLAEFGNLPAKANRAMTVLPSRRKPVPAQRTVARRAVARAAVSASFASKF